MRISAARSGQIPDANRPAQLALIRAWGGHAIDLGIAGDDDAAIIASLRGLEADLLLVTGGASVGDHDRVRPALQALGLTFNFWKIRMRPGKPLMFGALGQIPVLGLPGNPVSALVCSLLFLKPAIAAMTGGDASGPLFENARLISPIGKCLLDSRGKYRPDRSTTGSCHFEAVSASFPLSADALTGR